MPLSASRSSPGSLSLSKGAVPVLREVCFIEVTLALSVSNMLLRVDLPLVVPGCMGATWLGEVDRAVLDLVVSDCGAGV